MSVTKKHFPTFTIVTITLNNYSGLMKTWKSIESQDFEDFEWIVIDGGSNDKTIEFLRKKRSATRTALNPFRFVSQTDEGIYDAMNTGIKEAKGKYILFLNAGDRLASNDILSVMAPFTEKKPDFIYGDSLEPPLKKGQPPIYKKARRYKDIKWGMITHHQSMIYNRLVIRDHKLHYSLLYEIASDYDFTLRFLQKSKKMLYIPKPICIFEQGGISQQKASKGRHEQYLIREKLDIVSQAENLWIGFIQMLSWKLKTISPPLYRFLKSLILAWKDRKQAKKSTS